MRHHAGQAHRGLPHPSIPARRDKPYDRPSERTPHGGVVPTIPARRDKPYDPTAYRLGTRHHGPHNSRSAGYVLRPSGDQSMLLLGRPSIPAARDRSCADEPVGQISLRVPTIPARRDRSRNERRDREPSQTAGTSIPAMRDMTDIPSVLNSSSAGYSQARWPILHHSRARDKSCNRVCC